MEKLQFKTRSDFRIWLTQNALSTEGVWLLFDKSERGETITAAEALEDALCFGWIDGQIKSVDENTYIKYPVYIKDNKVVFDIYSGTWFATYFAKLEAGEFSFLKLSETIE